MKKLILLFGGLIFLNPLARAGTFTEYHSIYCGSILELGPVGYPTWNPASVVQAPKHGKVFIFTDSPFPDSLVYKSDYGYLGQDTFIVACAHATQITCDTGIYIISVIGCGPIISFTSEHKITCDSVLLIPGLGFPTWAPPVITQLPVNGEAVILGENLTDFDTLRYVPSPGFSGQDVVVVECAYASQITCATGTYVINVTCINTIGETDSQPGIKIYPNPASHFLILESDAPVEKWVLLAPAGQVLKVVQADAPFFQIKIPVEDLPGGIYLLKIVGKDWTTGRTVFLLR